MGIPRSINQIELTIEDTNLEDDINLFNFKGQNSVDYIKRPLTKNNKPLDIEDAFSKFINFKRSQNRKEETLQSYINHFRKFHFWNDTPLEFITTDTIINYTNYLLNDCNLSPHSVKSYKNHINTILNFFYKQGWIGHFEVVTFHVEDTIKEVYTDSEMALIIKRPTTITFTKLRNWAMCVMLAGTGMRIGTLANIQLKHIDIEEGTITYKHNKNKKLNKIPISGTLEKELKIYLNNYKKVYFKTFKTGGLNEELYLFPNLDFTPMRTRNASKCIKKHLKSRHILKGSAHLFRHTFAKNWLMNGGEAIQLKKILGHKDFKMVEHYSNMWGIDLKKNFDCFDTLSTVKTKIKETKTNNVKYFNY